MSFLKSLQQTVVKYQYCIYIQYLRSSRINQFTFWQNWCKLVR